MVDLDDAIVARLETHGETFEILLDPAVTDLLKSGKEIDLAEYMAVEDVFNNAGKGTRPPEEKIREAFGTSDVMEIARRIIEKGEVQITAEQRKEMQAAKKRQVVTYIAANAINPQTKTDPFKPVEKQVEEAMKLLKPVLPIRFEKTRVAIRLKGDAYGKCYDDMIHMGVVEREEWQADGSWIGIMEIPAGLIDELRNKLNSRTKGAAEVKTL